METNEKQFAEGKHVGQNKEMTYGVQHFCFGKPRELGKLSWGSSTTVVQ